MKSTCLGSVVRTLSYARKANAATPATAAKASFWPTAAPALELSDGEDELDDWELDPELDSLESESEVEEAVDSEEPDEVVAEAPEPEPEPEDESEPLQLACSGRSVTPAPWQILRA